MSKICEICREHPRGGSLMCGPCGRSYDRDAAKDTTIAGALRWAARRAWRAARRRAIATKLVPIQISPDKRAAARSTVGESYWRAAEKRASSPKHTRSVGRFIKTANDLRSKRMETT